MCLKFPGHESDPAKLLRECRRSHPAVQLRQRAMETPRQPDALAEGRLDAALIRPRPSYAAGVAARVIHREALWVALAADYPPLDSMLSTLVCAVDEETQPPEYVLHDGDLVDVIPPISGG